MLPAPFQGSVEQNVLPPSFAEAGEELGSEQRGRGGRGAQSGPLSSPSVGGGWDTNKSRWRAEGLLLLSPATHPCSPLRLLGRGRLDRTCSNLRESLGSDIGALPETPLHPRGLGWTLKELLVWMGSLPEGPLDTGQESGLERTAKGRTQCKLQADLRGGFCPGGCWAG